MLNATAARTSSSPFTATQWQELEHQALIFKYMVSGVPIPPELLYSVKRSLESSLASRLFPHQPIGWGCFQVGFGRKADPEPGRCRRTDGKKWRCSKEAYPDSKYCERHMHRGRNRSRKPVELSSSSNATNNTSTTTTSSTATTVLSNSSLQSSTARNLSSTTNTSPSTSSYSFSPLSSSAENEIHAHQNTFLNNPFLYPHSSSSSRPPGSAISPAESLYLDSGTSSHPDRDYRYYGMREGLDERTFFPEASGNSSMRSLQDSYGQLATSPYTGYNSQSQFQSFSNTSNKQEPQQQHCFVLGTDFKSSSSTTTNTGIRQIKLEKEADQSQKPLHHFFDS